MKLSKSLLVILSSLSLLLGTAACNGPSKDNKSEDQPTSQKSEGGQTSNSEGTQPSSDGGAASSEGTSSSADPVKGDENWVDYANNGSVKLSLDYSGKDFYVDGIGQFSLWTAIDGDTAHFTPAVDSLHKGTMKARFYGIDTPESTGKVQEYGKDASDYTKAMLKEADEKGTIVVSSAQDGYGEPQPDSTGQRYVSLVWINLTKKNAPKEELTLLNLMIVQEGLSWVKNVQSMPQYSDTFYAAERQADT